MKTTWKLTSIFVILVVIIAAMGIFPAAAASETKPTTLALTGATCASGDVKWETDGGYEYTDGSASISGGSGSVTITIASGFTFVSGCIKIGGPGGGSTIGITGPGTYGPFAYGISHVVISTDPEEEPEFCEDTTEGAVVWGGWTYSGDGLSRTRTGTITIYDANEPLYVCGTRQVTQTEYLYCTNEELDTTDWFAEGQGPEGSHIGACVPPPEYCEETVDGTTVWNDWVYSGDGLSRTRTGLVNLLDAEDQTYPCGTRPVDETEYLFCTDEEEDIEEWFPEGQAPEGSHAGKCDTPPPPKVGDPSAKAVCRTSDNGGVVWDVTFSIENATVHLPNQDVTASGVVTMLPGNYNLSWDANEGFEGEGVITLSLGATCEESKTLWKPQCYFFPCPVCQYENTRGGSPDCLGMDIVGTEDLKPVIVRVIEDCHVCGGGTDQEWYVVAFAEEAADMDSILDGEVAFPLDPLHLGIDGEMYRSYYKKIGMPRAIWDRILLKWFPHLMSWDTRLHAMLNGEIVETRRYSPCSLSLGYWATKQEGGKNYIQKLPGTDQWSVAEFFVKAEISPMPENWGDWNSAPLAAINIWYQENYQNAALGEWIELPDHLE